MNNKKDSLPKGKESFGFQHNLAWQTLII